MSEDGWAEADVRALGWPDGVGRLKLAELRTGRWQETERLSKSRQEGWKKEDSRERGPRGKSESASGIENGPGSRDDFLKRGEPLANQSKPTGNEGARTNAVGSADRAGRLGRQVGEKTGGERESLSPEASA
jgi:hypothetical protein